jgi:hypothetical protein
LVALSLLFAAGCSSAPASSLSSNPTPTETSGPTLVSLHGHPEGRSVETSFRAEAPPTWHSEGFVLVHDTDDPWLAVSVWTVWKVARNPCHPIHNLYNPGPTVNDLADALEAQPMRHATAPKDVTLGGYPGKYLEWSVPAHMVVTGDSSFKGCDVEPGGRREFTSWLSGGSDPRWQQMAGQVDRLWILNVDGQRLVVDATHSPDATQAQLDEENRIVKSMTFVPAP